MDKSLYPGDQQNTAMYNWSPCNIIFYEIDLNNVDNIEKVFQIQ